MIFRPFFNALLVCALLCLGAPLAGAQTAANATSQQAKDDAAELKEIRRLAAEGFYNDAIERATLAIETTAQPNKDLFFLRGYSRRYLSQYEKAIEDLQDLGDYKLTGNWPTASAMVSLEKQCIATRPPNEELVQLPSGTWIRIYYGEDSAFTRNAMRDVAQGFEAATRFFGVRTNDASAFLFSDSEYDKFEAFQMATRGRLLTSWVQLYNNDGAIILSQKNGLGNVLDGEKTSRMSTIVHEFSHVLVKQIIGKYPKDFPNWMSEGIAEVGTTELLPERLVQNDKTMRYLLKQDAIYPFETVTSRQLWADAMIEKTGTGAKGSPYAQGFHMTRFLQMRLAQAGKSDFLLTMRRLKSFDLALKESLNLTPQQFYDEWFQFLQDQNASTP